MDIKHEQNGSGGRFVGAEGSTEAEMTYAAEGAGRLVFDHTFVPPALRGRGIAEKLVEAGVAYARAEQATIVPACSYVRALFDRHPERYADVRAR